MQERLDPRGLDITDYLKNPVLLAHHSYHNPIGQVDGIDIREDGVHFSAWIGDPAKSELTSIQKEIRSLVSQGILKTVSVGFIPKKVRPCEYDSQGALTAPAIIESWELLELSVVAVPCNQDSVFATRSMPDNEPVVMTTAKRLEDILIDNLVVKNLIFDKDIHSKENSCKWAADHGFKCDLFEDDGAGHYLLPQREEKDFEPETIRTVYIEGGIEAMIGKTKMDVPVAPAPDAAPAAGDQASNGQLLDGQKQMIALLELIVSKLDAKPESEPSGEMPEAPATGADATAGKEIDDRITKLEKSFDKLINSVSLIVDKLSK